MIFVLGALSALIVGACVSPLLISVLSIAILHGDPWLGAALMSALALGMGVILIAAGAGAGYLIPRNGLWMERVKQIFGVMLLGVAIYLLGAVPDVPVLLLWAALFIITAVYLGATRALPQQASGWQILFKGMGTVLLVWGVLAMIGGFSGNRNILAPVSLESFGNRGLLQSEATITTAHFTQIDSLSTLGNALKSANASGHKVLLDFYADWCTDCIRMEESTFRDPGVTAALADYRLLQVDITDPDDPKTSAIKKRYGVFGPPAMLFFNANGDENTAQRLYGYTGPQAFVALLKTL
jgi:thiol:disulfide interchange protein DsbD